MKGLDANVLVRFLVADDPARDWHGLRSTLRSCRALETRDTVASIRVVRRMQVVDSIQLSMTESGKRVGRPRFSRP
ncbi:MAG: hypothetical protein ACKV22_16320, partial [Bryobacteraceae bacterium]